MQTFRQINIQRLLLTAKCHFDNKTDRSTFNVGRSALALYKELYKNKIAPLMERYFVRQYVFLVTRTRIELVLPP